MKRALIIHDTKRYKDALDFADIVGTPEPRTLERQIRYLLLGSFWEADELHITNDFAPHSFGFHFTKNGSPVGFGGAIICHGIGDPLAVTMEQSERPFWSVHT
jgi:hypothetical protein